MGKIMTATSRILRHVIMPTAFSICMAQSMSAETQSWPVPAPPADDSGFGRNIQRAMTLMASSTPEKRNTVRILFYGQSITAQPWSRKVEQFLKETYPNANLVVAHRAIGGFGAERLVRTAEADLYPFNPDLMIFHVYFADPSAYEAIIRRTSERTTADILIVNDHVLKDADMAEETDPAKLTDQKSDGWKNYVFLPGIARKYGVELCDLRTEWKRYLKDNKLPAKELLRDNVHLNDHGCHVMGELVKQHLRHRPEQSDASWRARVVTTALDTTKPWKDNKLEFEFEGNRIDIVGGPNAAPSAPVKILIDGRAPSTLPGAVVFTRASSYPDTWWPALMQVGSHTPPILEKWTAKITDASDDLKSFRFEVSGSVTGPDGAGSSAERFVSKSGRVAIEPEDWHLAFARSYSKKPMPENFTVSWDAKPMSTDEYQPPKTIPGVESAVTVAQSLSDGKHRLTLTAPPETQPALTALRVYRPSPAVKP